MNGHIGRIAGAEVVKSKKVLKATHELSASGATGALEIVASGATGAQINITSVTGIYDTTNKASVTPEVGLYVTTAATVYYFNPIVVTDAQDPNEDPKADKFDVVDPAITIYMKRNVQVESDRDILKKTTVLSGDEHYVAVLSNPSKVVLAKNLVS